MRSFSTMSFLRMARWREASSFISSTSLVVSVSCTTRLLAKKSSIFAMPDGMSPVEALTWTPILLCMDTDFSSSSTPWYPSEANFASIFSLSHAVMSAVNDRSTCSMRM